MPKLLKQCVHIGERRSKIIRRYSELIKLKTFKERYDYLRLGGVVGEDTFGFDRYLNQILYTSKRWRQSRDKVIVRDLGLDLGVDGFEIGGKIIVHHMNPITIEDIELDRFVIYDPEFLISTSFDTHQAIHFSDESLLPLLPTARSKNDTAPWLQERRNLWKKVF